MSLKISVVVPSLNQARFLPNTLSSILNQRGSFSVECIVVDGGSTDGSRDVIADFAAAFGSDLKWSSETDDGQTDAINRGLSRASGDILAYLNSDDCYSAGALAQVAAAFESDPARLWLTGDCTLIDEEGVEIQRFVRVYRRWWLRRFSRTRLTMLNFIAQPATFWRREAMERAGLFDERLHYTMDYDYWLRLSALGLTPHYIDAPLAQFRIHGESKGGSRYKQQFQEDYATACRYTDRGAVKTFHRLHNAAIVFAYGVLK
jgi:glycosyltransferase involved in cell wall biosynthesis